MRVFLDTSVFIWAAERPDSNSGNIVVALFDGRFEGVVDELVLAELSRYYRPRRGREFAWLAREQVRRICRVIAFQECEVEALRIREPLKPADRPHLAACRAGECSFLVAYDSDFVPAQECREPRAAAQELRLALRDTPW